MMLGCGLIPTPVLAMDPMSGLSPSSWLGSPMGSSPWSGFGSTMGPMAFPYMPSTPGMTPPMPSDYGMTPSMPSDYARPYLDRAYEAWPGGQRVNPGGFPGRETSDSHQPDLTGHWRGSGGETVEIQRNRARIWGGSHQSCSCVFFLVGQRLIAYSPDSDRVRKYWFQREARDSFNLIDESGNLMSFWRTR
jgi:hypothetical protein